MFAQIGWDVMDVIFNNSCALWSPSKAMNPVYVLQNTVALLS